MGAEAGEKRRRNAENKDEKRAREQKGKRERKGEGGLGWRRAIVGAGARKRVREERKEARGKEKMRESGLQTSTSGRANTSNRDYLESERKE